MAKTRNAWQGTLMPVFQPAEEAGVGAQAMIDDGLFERFPRPSVILGQHVMVGSSGEIGTRPVMAAVQATWRDSQFRNSW